MKTYYLKLTALSPIHIGSGEDYEPTNFIIDNGFLYEFDEMAFYRHLSADEKRQFNSVVSQNSADMLFKIHAFVKQHKESAIAVAKNKVAVTHGIMKDYESKIGRMVQREGSGRGDTKRVFNQFQIIRNQRLQNVGSLYIPGSSVKGAISTAIQEQIFKKDRRKWDDKFKRVNPSMSTFKNILVSDLQPVESNGTIGFSLNKERFEDDEEGPTNKIEAINPKSSFIGTVSFKELKPTLETSMPDLIDACNLHYKANLDSLFDEKDHIKEYLPADFLKACKTLTLDDTQFLLRVGRHSGARAVTIEGLRDIRIKVSGGGKNRKPNIWENLPEETTTWLFGADEHQTQDLLPFGWLMCELIDEAIYVKLAAIQQEKLNILQEEKSVQIQKQKTAEEAARKEAEAKEKEKNREAAEQKAKEEAEAARLASLSPVDRLLEEHNAVELIQMMQNSQIDDYGNSKIELATKIKVKLQDSPKTWDKAKQKALKRKEFIQSILDNRD